MPVTWFYPIPVCWLRLVQWVGENQPQWKVERWWKSQASASLGCILRGAVKNLWAGGQLLGQILRGRDGRPLVRCGE